MPTFTEIGLPEPVLRSLADCGYVNPTPIQEQAIPVVLSGRDLIGAAQTGTGKTAAFALPTLARLGPAAGKPRCLVLVPTRELAVQVDENFQKYGKYLGTKTALLYGGVGYGIQVKALEEGVDVVIATPGRLLDLHEQKILDLSSIQVLILDEVDRMLDMGFIEDIEHIVRQTPESRQTLLFSATLDGMVGKIAAEMTNNPLRVDVENKNENKANIDQRILFSDDIGHKHRMLDVLLRDVELTQAVIFTATKRSAEELSETLLEQGYSAAALHGDMPQHKRTRTLQRLRDGHTRVLVATDVAARGIDVAGISHVINFDAPRQAEDYVHRIGRTGRAGRSGIAITMVHGKERYLVREIERYIGESVRIDVIPGLEPSARPERTFDKSRGGKSGYGNKSAGGYSKPWGEKKTVDRPAGERSWGEKHYADNKPTGDRPWAEKKWADKPRGEYQGRSQGYPPRDAAAPRHDDDNRGNSFSHGEGRPAREGNTWNRPEKNGNTWVKPEGTAAAKPAWVNKSDARPAFKSSGPRTEDHRPSAPKPRGRQSW